MTAVRETFPPAPSITGTSLRRSRGFYVVAASETDALELLRTEANVYRGVTYQDHNGNAFDQYLICQTIAIQPLSPVPSGGTGLYLAEAYYGYATLIYDAPPRPDLAVRRWIETSEDSVVTELSRTGSPIKNSVGQMFDPPATKMVDRETRVIEWHVFADNWDAAYNPKRVYRKKLNATGYEGAEPRSLMCRNVTCDEVPIPNLAGTGTLFRLRAYLEYRLPVLAPDNQVFSGWDEIRLNFGTRLVRQDGTGYDPILSVPNDPLSPVISEPVLLSLDGRSILPPNATATYFAFQLYNSIDFAGLV